MRKKNIKYLVNIVSGNDGIKSTIEIIEQSNHLQRSTLCCQLREPDNIREVHWCLLEVFRHSLVRSLQFFSDDAKTYSNSTGLFSVKLNCAKNHILLPITLRNTDQLKRKRPIKNFNKAITKDRPHNKQFQNAMYISIYPKITTLLTIKRKFV